MQPRKLKIFALAVLITTLIFPLISVGIAAPVTSMRLEEGDIEAAPYIMIYKSDGNYPMNHWVNTDCMHPIINVDDNNASIRIRVGISGNVYYPAAQGTLMNAGGYLTKVSYSASWQGNKETTVYTGDSANHIGVYQFNLTGIPYGNQSITVYASGNILLFENDFASTYPAPQSNDQSVSFTVTRSQAQTTLDVSQSKSSTSAAIGYEYAMLIAVSVTIIVVISVINRRLKSKKRQLG